MTRGFFAPMTRGFFAPFELAVSSRPAYNPGGVGVRVECAGERCLEFTYPARNSGVLRTSPRYSGNKLQTAIPRRNSTASRTPPEHCDTS